MHPGRLRAAAAAAVVAAVVVVDVEARMILQIS